jgi:hypothetical protein
MSTRTTITKDESNILVAIGKIETQMDGLRGDIAGGRIEIEKINTGLANRVLNLEGNSVSKLEVNPKLDEYENRITVVESDIASDRASRKVWVIVGGGAWTIATIIFSVWLSTKLF